MRLIDKRSFSGFISGIVFSFAFFSVMVMNPEQMWRWLLHKDMNDKKVERALSRPDIIVQKLEARIVDLQQKIIKMDNDYERDNEYLINDNKNLSSLIDELKSEINVKENLISKLENDLKDTSINIRNSKSTTKRRDTSTEGKRAAIFYTDYYAEEALYLRNALEEMGMSVHLELKENSSLDDYRKDTMLYSDNQSADTVVNLKQQLKTSYDITYTEYSSKCPVDFCFFRKAY